MSSEIPDPTSGSREPLDIRTLQCFHLSSIILSSELLAKTQIIGSALNHYQVRISEEGAQHCPGVHWDSLTTELEPSTPFLAATWPLSWALHSALKSFLTPDSRGLVKLGILFTKLGSTADFAYKSQLMCWNVVWSLLLRYSVRMKQMPFLQAFLGYCHHPPTHTQPVPLCPLISCVALLYLCNVRPGKLPCDTLC